MAEIERRVHPEVSEVQPDLFCARLIYQARGKGQPEARFVGFDTEEWNTKKRSF